MEKSWLETTVTQITAGYSQSLNTSKLSGTFTSSLQTAVQNPHHLHEEDKMHILELLPYFVVVEPSRSL